MLAAFWRVFAYKGKICCFDKVSKADEKTVSYTHTQPLTLHFTYTYMHYRKTRGRRGRRMTRLCTGKYLAKPNNTNAKKEKP